MHAVELDGTLCEALDDHFESEIAAGRLTVQQGNATRCDLPEFEMVVSNHPNSVSSKIMFRLLDIGFLEVLLIVCVVEGTLLRWWWGNREGIQGWGLRNS